MPECPMGGAQLPQFNIKTHKKAPVRIRTFKGLNGADLLFETVSFGKFLFSLTKKQAMSLSKELKSGYRG